MDIIKEIIAYPFDHHWADFLGIVGFPLALWGFLLTIHDARQAKSAAETAQAEVQNLKQTLLRLDSVENLADAIAIMDEIKRLHRYDVWDNVLLDRYSTLRRKLVAIKINNVDTKDDYQTAIQSAIAQFRTIEQTVEKSLSGKGQRPTTAKLNSLISMQIDRMDEVLNAMKQDAGD